MFLTQMHLNPVRRGTRFLLASPQRMHAAVLAGFPPSAPSATPEGRVLWRTDRGLNTSLTLYVSSPRPPDLTHLVEQAGWPTGTDPWRTVQTDQFLERLDKGQEWVYRLTANPVRSVRPADGGRGKRQGHVTVTQQEEWLRGRAEGWGFDPVAVSVTGRGQPSFARRTEDQRHQVTLRIATYDGLLRITDPDLMRAALINGVGRAKGYGCGLLTLAPPR